MFRFKNYLNSLCPSDRIAVRKTVNTMSSQVNLFFPLNTSQFRFGAVYWEEDTKDLLA